MLVCTKNTALMHRAGWSLKLYLILSLGLLTCPPCAIFSIHMHCGALSKNTFLHSHKTYVDKDTYRCTSLNMVYISKLLLVFPASKYGTDFMQDGF